MKKGAVVWQPQMNRQVHCCFSVKMSGVNTTNLYVKQHFLWVQVSLLNSPLAGYRPVGYIFHLCLSYFCLFQCTVTCYRGFWYKFQLLCEKTLFIFLIMSNLLSFMFTIKKLKLQSLIWKGYSCFIVCLQSPIGLNITVYELYGCLFVKVDLIF